MSNVIIPNKKEPVISIILSLFVPGLGQIYNAQIKKGAILFVAYVASIILVYIVWANFIGFCIMLVPLAIWLYGMFDAFVEARKINKGEPSKDWLQ
jgi:TM2 domain-containing membrane protein YozV